MSSESTRSNHPVRVSLELFEGPLDLLLHLIMEQHIDIAAIPIARITVQYLESIDLMKEMDLDIAGEYLVMAATLILIKSRMLLPPSTSSLLNETGGEDPREELIARLKAYQTYREAGRHLGELLEIQSRHIVRPLSDVEQERYKEWVLDANLVDLLSALRDVIERRFNEPVHLVAPNPISIREKMSTIMKTIKDKGSVLIFDLFTACTSKSDAIGIFLAVLELIRLRAIQARQRKPYGNIRLLPYSSADYVDAGGI